MSNNGKTILGRVYLDPDSQTEQTTPTRLIVWDETNNQLKWTDTGAIIDDSNYLKLTGETEQSVEGLVNFVNATIASTPLNANDIVSKAYADGLVVGLFRLANVFEFDASGGTYPLAGTGTGAGGAIRKGDSYVVTVAGTINGQDYGVGDTFYAKINVPGQTPANWGRFEVPAGIATNLVAGIMFLYSGTGSNTNGTMTQAAITTALNAKISNGSLKTVGGFSIEGGPGNVTEIDNDLSASTTRGASKTAVNNALIAKANDADVIHKTGNETRTGMLTNNGEVVIGNTITTGSYYISIFPSPSVPANIQGLQANVGIKDITLQSAGGNVGFGNVTAPSRIIDTGSAPIKIGDGVNTTDAATISQLNLKANIASPALTGTPTAPTATAGTNTTQIATTSFVTNGLASKANTASPTFTGDPKAPTPAPGDNDTSIATTAFVANAIAGISSARQNAVSVSGAPTTFNITLALFGNNGILTVYVDASTSAKTIVLPNYTDMISNYVVKIIKVDSTANAVTIQGDSNINGAATFLLTSQYQNVQIESGLTHYWITN